MSSASAPPTDQRQGNDGQDEQSAGAPGRPEPSEAIRAIDLTHGGPPPELLDQMAHADEINMRLRRRGCQISFELSADGCSLQIELRDRAGSVLRVLSLSEATDIAEGGVLPD